MKHSSPLRGEQLTLFQIAPTAIIKTTHDPYWDEAEEITTENQPVAVGDWVKISLEWMNNCVKVAGRQFQKDYRYQSEDDLECIVKWVDPVSGK